MPDMSDYLHTKKVALLTKGKEAADPLKYRAPTRDTAYDPNLMGSVKCGDGSPYCNPGVKHNLFAAKMLACNPTYTTG